MKYFCPRGLCHQKSPLIGKYSSTIVFFLSVKRLSTSTILFLPPIKPNGFLSRASTQISHIVTPVYGCLVAHFKFTAL